LVVIRTDLLAASLILMDSFPELLLLPFLELPRVLRRVVTLPFKLPLLLLHSFALYSFVYCS
jgi:hypothetical protein